MSVHYTQEIDAESAQALKCNDAARQVQNAAAIALLDEWSAGDEREQRVTWETVRRALDEDRTSDRKLFPQE